MTALACLVGLVYLSLDLYGLYHFGRLQTGFGIDAFFIAKHGLAGVFLTLVLSVVFSLEQPKGAKIGLAVAGACFVAFNLYVLTHLGFRSLVPAVRLFCQINGLLMGMASVLAVLLWRAGREGGIATLDEAEPEL